MAIISQSLFKRLFPTACSISIPRCSQSIIRLMQIFNRYRGSSPIETSILSGDTCVGASIILMNTKEIDAGDILKQVSIVGISIYLSDLQTRSADEPLETTRNRLATLSAQLTIELIKDVNCGAGIKPVSQAPIYDPEMHPKCYKIGHETSIFSPLQHTANQIYWRRLALTNRVHLPFLA